MFDALIIGAGAAGMSCALVLGSAKDKPFAQGRQIGIIAHQKTSHLQNALFNNVLGLVPGTTGEDILEKGPKQLTDLYPHIQQIDAEKVTAISGELGKFMVTTNKNIYQAKLVVIAAGYTKFFTIKGLAEHIIPHSRTAAEKERIELKNEDHLIRPGLYVAGTLAGWRSQFAMACGSGAHVATDILTFWNNGKHTKVHDKTQ